MELKRNRYVWRLDLSLLGEENYNSEIGREVKKNIVLYKFSLLIGMFCSGVLFLTPIILFICHADLTYIKLSGIVALFVSLMYGKLLIIPKITGNDIKNLEDELTEKSDRMDYYNVILIFTENTLIIQQGIMLYRIPYLKIIRIRVKRQVRYGNLVHFILCDDTKVKLSYFGNHSQSFEQLWEQLLKCNPNIMIEDSLQRET